MGQVASEDGADENCAREWGAGSALDASTGAEWAAPNAEGPADDVPGRFSNPFCCAASILRYFFASPDCFSSDDTFLMNSTTGGGGVRQSRGLAQTRRGQTDRGARCCQTRASPWTPLRARWPGCGARWRGRRPPGWSVWVERRISIHSALGESAAAELGTYMA